MATIKSLRRIRRETARRYATYSITLSDGSSCEFCAETGRDGSVRIPDLGGNGSALAGIVEEACAGVHAEMREFVDQIFEHILRRGTGFDHRHAA